MPHRNPSNFKRYRSSKYGLASSVDLTGAWTILKNCKGINFMQFTHLENGVFRRGFIFFFYKRRLIVHVPKKKKTQAYNDIMVDV